MDAPWDRWQLAQVWSSLAILTILAAVTAGLAWSQDAVRVVIADVETTTTTASMLETAQAPTTLPAGPGPTQPSTTTSSISTTVPGSVDPVACTSQRVIAAAVAELEGPAWTFGYDPELDAAAAGPVSAAARDYVAALLTGQTAEAWEVTNRPLYAEATITALYPGVDRAADCSTTVTSFEAVAVVAAVRHDGTPAEGIVVVGLELVDGELTPAGLR